MLPSESERNTQFEVNTQTSRPHYKPTTVRAPKTNEKKTTTAASPHITNTNGPKQDTPLGSKRWGSLARGIRTGGDGSVPSNKVLRSPWAHPRVLRSPQLDRVTSVALGVRQPVARTSLLVHLTPPAFSPVTPPWMEMLPFTVTTEGRRGRTHMPIFTDLFVFYCYFYLWLQCRNLAKGIIWKGQQIIK